MSLKVAVSIPNAMASSKLTMPSPSASPAVTIFQKKMQAAAMVELNVVVDDADDIKGLIAAGVDPSNVGLSSSAAAGKTLLSCGSVSAQLPPLSAFVQIGPISHIFVAVIVVCPCTC